MWSSDSVLLLISLVVDIFQKQLKNFLASQKGWQKRSELFFFNKNYEQEESAQPLV